MKKAQQLAEKLKQYIPKGDGYNSEFANDLLDAVEYLEGLKPLSDDEKGG